MLYSMTDDVSHSFYGLRGVQLNIAIAVIAGTDFALFGYDQVLFTFSYGVEPHTDRYLGCPRWPAYSAILPEALPGGRQH